MTARGACRAAINVSGSVRLAGESKGKLTWLDWKAR
jgi:hypothetical protein